MVRFLDTLLSGSRKHVGDEQLLALMDGELSRVQALRVQRHLESCWSCRARQGRLQGVIHGFVDYSNEVIAPLQPPPPLGRDRFLAALDAELAVKSARRWFYPFRLLRTVYERSMNPVFITVLVLVGAAAILTAVWHRAAGTSMTAAEFFTKALQAEQVSQREAGVAYQRVEIRSRRHIVERAIYRDLEQKRIAVQAKPSATEASIRSRLASAGVDWETPLSALNYDHWRNKVHVLKESVNRSAPGEWTLTTETDDSTVRSASLTVRDVDFHPIAREIVFRDAEEIQIAELNYDLLPWSAVNASLFEPMAAKATAGVIADTNPPLLPLLPTRTELEGAELMAQLALINVHVDAGADIHDERGDTRVYVRGLVDTDRRKQEIENQLAGIPLLKPELRSIEQIERQRQVASAGATMHVYPTDLGQSPLETYLASKGTAAEQRIAFSRTLTQSSLVIDQEAHALAVLDTRYGDSSEEMTDENRRLLEELKQQHLATLAEALGSEEAALSLYVSNADVAATHASQTLSDLAIRNQQLCLDLVTGTDEDSHTVAGVLQELAQVSSMIRRVLVMNQSHLKP